MAEVGLPTSEAIRKPILHDHVNRQTAAPIHDIMPERCHKTLREKKCSAVHLKKKKKNVVLLSFKDRSF